MAVLGLCLLSLSNIDIQLPIPFYYVLILLQTFNYEKVAISSQISHFATVGVRQYKIGHHLH